jgi:hypothetical protein
VVAEVVGQMILILHQLIVEDLVAAVETVLIVVVLVLLVMLEDIPQ